MQVCIEGDKTKKLCCPECGGNKIVEAQTRVYDLKIDCFDCVEYEMLDEAMSTVYVCKDCNHTEDVVDKFIIG